MNGYQSGIIYAIGSMTGGRMCVRSVDRWNCDAVQPVFGTAVYSQVCRCREKMQFVVKSAKVERVNLCDVADVVGFCRAYLEIHGVLDMKPAKDRRGNRIWNLRLRVYGKEEVLGFLMEHLPANPKKIQKISNSVDGGAYTGETCAIYYQSRKEIAEILEYIDGEPKNERIWRLWMGTMA